MQSVDKIAIMVFGVGELQRSIILKAKSAGLYVVGIDPNKNAACKDSVDAFEVVGPDDYETTLKIAIKYNVSAVLTASTDKPLLMMSRIAQALPLSFFSIETAIASTDKFLMKQRFLKEGIKCASGRLISDIEELDCLDFPVVMKPRDNSGSRGVIFCDSLEKAAEYFSTVRQFTKKQDILVEEYIGGKEYSIEALHFNGRTEILQYTEKFVTPLPYNVELGHIQPADLSIDIKTEINNIIESIARCMGYCNCASHTELKINDKGIFVIETSPRLGGDYITSHLVGLSTGIDMERCLIDIALGLSPDLLTGRCERAAGVRYLSLPKGVVKEIKPQIKELETMNGMLKLSLNICEGQEITDIHNSLERYGSFIVVAKDRTEVIELSDKFNMAISSCIVIR